MSLILKGIDLPKASNEDCIAVIRSNGNYQLERRSEMSNGVIITAIICITIIVICLIDNDRK